MKVILFSFLFLFSFAQSTNQAIQVARTLDIVEIFEDFTVLSNQLVANLVDEKLFSNFSSGERKTYQDYQKLLKKYYSPYRDVTLIFLKKHKDQINEILALGLNSFSREELLSLQLETKEMKNNKIFKKHPIFLAKMAKKFSEKIIPFLTILTLQDPKMANYGDVATKVFDTKLAKFKTPSPSNEKKIKEYVNSFLPKKNYDQFIKTYQKQVGLPFFPPLLDYNSIRRIVLEAISQTYSDAQIEVLKRSTKLGRLLSIKYDEIEVSKLGGIKKRNKTLQKDVEEKTMKLFTKYLSLLEPLNQQFLKEPLIISKTKKKKK